MQQLTGILRSWNEDRGFGFIAPTHGGAEIFVHVSAFPRDGSRPVEGECLKYELGRGRNGKPQAVRVVRQAFGARPTSSKVIPRRRTKGTPLRLLVMALLAFAGITYGYNRLVRSAGQVPGRPAESMLLQTPAQEAFRCDGRTHCSQMTSCAEATYFLKHCPGAKMDGNHDGVPCEQQWCK